MRSRMLAASLLLLGFAAPVVAQRPCAECDRPSDLPPLLPVPVPMPGASRSPVPRGPSGEYDPGYFYLPERAPERTGPTACGPAGRFWIGAGLELAWLKPQQAPALVRIGSTAG